MISLPVSFLCLFSCETAELQRSTSCPDCRLLTSLPESDVVFKSVLMAASFKIIILQFMFAHAQ